MAIERDAESLHKVIQNLNQFSETVDVTRKKFSKLFSEVLHVPLNDSGSILKLKMFGSLYADDFASHLKHLKEMCSTLETADASPITLKKLKKNIGSSLFKGKMALKKIDRIDNEAIKETIEQISELKELASKFKKLKEDQKKAFEGSEKEGNEGTKKAIMSKLKAFIAEEARKAFFESELETDPEILLTTLKDIESSLQDVCKLACGYKEVLQTVLDKMTEVKGEDNQDAVLQYISGMKDGAREIVQECEKISK